MSGVIFTSVTLLKSRIRTDYVHHSRKPLNNSLKSKSLRDSNPAEARAIIPGSQTNKN